MTDLKQLVRCPLCRGSLTWNGDAKCEAGHSFSVVDGIPVLTPKEAGSEEAQHAHQREHYDREHVGRNTYRLENWQKVYLERVRPLWEQARSGGAYLDSGAGGNAYTVIEAARQGIPSVGTDISLESMRTARRLAQAEGVAESCLFVVCAAESLPFKDDAFAGAASVAVLEHIPDDVRAINELSRVTRPGGRIFFAVPNSMDRMPAVLRPLYRRHDRKVGHLRHYSAADLISKSSSAGLQPVRVAYSAHWIKVWQLLVHLAAGRLGLNSDRLWWWFEARDARRYEKDNGLHLNLWLERK
jgi:ubiquinone/menaquinone biosynthesis C-methylase UbiE/uncharacterized protein YbaR (Trm112 family)